MIAAHLEYLLRKHDCVVIPGMGALLCNYVPAHFDGRCDDVLNPPGRALAFNELLSDSDGLLAASIARKEGLAYEAGARLMNEEIEMMRRQLDCAGEFQLGRLGRFCIVDGRVVFEPEHLPSINGFLYGLRPVPLIPLDAKAGQDGGVASRLSPDAGVEMKDRFLSRRSWRAYATGVAASLAVLVTVAMFFISPIRVGTRVDTASIAPVPSAAVDVAADDAGNTADAIVREASGTDDVAMTPPPAIEVCPEETEDPTVIEAERIAGDEPAHGAMRFNDDDSYCVIVASFPTEKLAEVYMSQHSGKRLGILAKDGKFRVYAATSATYAGVDGQRKLIGQSDAWICRR